ncbi:GPI anchored serine-threonine rich family protein [Patescibacteria group bacterium]|nr:GPI anchored serine-threonine rich family protein [Patescibacteria group bacterium]
MNRNRGIALTIIIVALGGWYWLSHPSPTLSITSPASGATWQAGEERTITWKSRGLGSDKIAITIRRIPPPPLQEEGQEFDPVIFTDLPNTGSASWKISPQYPNGTYAITVHAYPGTLVTNEIVDESEPFALTHPSLLSSLLPLYAGATWQAPEVETFFIGTTTYTGASATSNPVTDTMDPASIFSPFERFYEEKLSALGYRVVNALAAGGHVGGQTGYQKGAETVLVRFHIDYHTISETSPSECPCDVTLSVFSSAASSAL